MNSNNGHTNGQTNGQIVGGNGGLADSQAIIDLAERRHRRETLLILRRSIANGWVMPDDVDSKVPAMLWDIANDTNATHRDRTAAARVLASMKDQNLKALEVLDKLERLDTGQSTDNQLQIHVVYEEPPLPQERT